MIAERGPDQELLVVKRYASAKGPSVGPKRRMQPFLRLPCTLAELINIRSARGYSTRDAAYARGRRRVGRGAGILAVHQRKKIVGVTFHPAIGEWLALPGAGVVEITRQLLVPRPGISGQKTRMLASHVGKFALRLGLEVVAISAAASIPE